jgi:ribosome-binding ATPase YchF (GTP1/OBG family)
MGKGLGNRFLDDLRHADALVHVVDVSGTTDAEGKATRGYDPSQDIVWLRSEIVRWIQGNLMEKWGSIKRRHVAVKATPIETLQNQFSGYGSTAAVVARCLDRLGLLSGTTKVPLEHWDDETIERVVNAFTDEKFPTVIALNKIDHPDADKNIAKIAKTADPKSIVLCSAISEVFLRKLAKQGFVKYTEGSEFVDTREDLIEMGDPDGGDLKELDDKLKQREPQRHGSVPLRQHRRRAGPVARGRAAGPRACVPRPEHRELYLWERGQHCRLQGLRAGQEGQHGWRCVQEGHGRCAVGVCGD